MHSRRRGDRCRVEELRAVGAVLLAGELHSVAGIGSRIQWAVYGVSGGNRDRGGKDCRKRCITVAPLSFGRGRLVEALHLRRHVWEHDLQRLDPLLKI